MTQETNDTPEVVTFSQQQLDAIITDRLRRARDAHMREVTDKLGMPVEDAVKQLEAHSALTTMYNDAKGQLEKLMEAEESRMYIQAVTSAVDGFKYNGRKFQPTVTEFVAAQLRIDGATKDTVGDALPSIVERFPFLLAPEEPASGDKVLSGATPKRPAITNTSSPNSTSGSVVSERRIVSQF